MKNNCVSGNINQMFKKRDRDVKSFINALTVHDHCRTFWILQKDTGSSGHYNSWSCTNKNTFHSHSRFHDITFSSLTYVTVDHKTSYKGQFIIWKQNKEAFRWCMGCKDRTLFGWDKTIWKSGIWGSKNIKILRKSPLKFTFTFTFMHLADAFIQSDLQCIQAIHFFLSVCVPWESNPQPLCC